MMVENDNEDWQHARLRQAKQANKDWHSARIGQDHAPAFQPLEPLERTHGWEADWSVQPVERIPGEDRDPHPLAGLPWYDPDELTEAAKQNEAAQVLYMTSRDVACTVPECDEDDLDPAVEHVPPLSEAHGRQICEVDLDGESVTLHMNRAGKWSQETNEFPEGFHGQMCRFFDAGGSLRVMVFEADGVNTLIYDFFTGQVLGSGPMPEAIDWDLDTLQKVSSIDGEGLQVVVTNYRDEIRHIMIGI